MNTQLPDQLSAQLKQPLPGWQAQAAYQPELSFGRHCGPAPTNARPAAVLVLIYPRQRRWHVPLMLRPKHMPDHPGQVSFPGGVIEAGETSRQAALREFSEELGAPFEGLRILGQLSPVYLFASNFQISPWVAASPEAPAWRPSANEVERLLEVPLVHLADPRNSGLFERRQRGLAFRAPCFQWQGDRIWGATSMILAELVATLKQLDI